MTARRDSLRGRSEEGVTLIETLAVLAISSIIMIPLLGWAMLALQEQETARNRNIDGASIGLLRTYFVRDVASANGAATGADAEGTDCSGGAGAATAPDQTLLRLEGNDGEYVVYNEGASSGGAGLSIWRRECDGTTLTATTEVVDRVAPGGTAVTCSARAGAPETDCGRVNFTLVTVEAETVSMTATVRAGEQDDGGGPSGGPVYVSPDVIIQVSPTTVFRGDTVTFDASGSSNPGGGPLTHHWDFDDGTSSTSAVATRSYDTLGEFTALYTATNADGTPASEFIRITVENRPPNAVISAPSGGFSTTRCADVSFAAAGSNDSGDGAYGGNVVEYRWNYDDGETSTRTSPAAHTHQFRTLGPNGGTAPLSVALVVVDNEGGGSLAAIRPVLVRNRPPSTPAITADGATGTIPADPTVPVEFVSTVSDPDLCDTSGEVLSYEWDFGDGQTSVCTVPTCEATTHTYTQSGTYTAVLTVTDTGGASVISNEIIVELETSSTVASFTMAPATARAGVPLPAGWITNTSADPDGAPLTAAWTFPNGTPATSDAWDPPSVTFTHNVGDDDTFISAEYTVGLTVTDGAGTRHVAERTITVTGAPAPDGFRATGGGCLNPAACGDGRFISFAWDPVPDSSGLQIQLECTSASCTESMTQDISGAATSYVFGGLGGGPSARSYDARIRTLDSVTGKWGAWSDPAIDVSS